MSPTTRRLLTLALVLGFVCTLSACVSRGTYPPAGFLSETSGMTDSQRDDKFEQEWVSSDKQQVMKLRTFKRIQVRPLNVEHLTDRADFSQADLEKLQRSFREAFEDRLGQSHTLVPANAAPDADTLVVDAALTKVYQPWRLINVIMTFVLSPISNGGAAIEARLVDGGSNESLAKFAEEQKGAWHLGSILIGGYFKYYDAEKVFAAWANRLDEWLSEES